MNAPIDVPQPQPAEPPGRTKPPQEPEILPPEIPRPGDPIPGITNPVPGPGEPSPSGPAIVPPGVTYLP